MEEHLRPIGDLDNLKNGIDQQEPSLSMNQVFFGCAQRGRSSSRSSSNQDLVQRITTTDGVTNEKQSKLQTSSFDHGLELRHGTPCRTVCRTKFQSGCPDAGRSEKLTPPSAREDRFLTQHRKRRHRYTVTSAHHFRQSFQKTLHALLTTCCSPITSPYCCLPGENYQNKLQQWTN